MIVPDPERYRGVPMCVCIYHLLREVNKVKVRYLRPSWSVGFLLSLQLLYKPVEN